MREKCLGYHWGGSVDMAVNSAIRMQSEVMDIVASDQV